MSLHYILTNENEHDKTNKDTACADPEGGGAGGPDFLENYKNIGFLSNTGRIKATKPACNVGPSSARQRNAIEMAFHWRAVDG